MKNTGKIFGIVVLVTVVLSMAACATSGGGSTPGGTSTPGTFSTPIGKYISSEDNGYTIEFKLRSRFEMKMSGYTFTGTFSRTGASLFLEVTDTNMPLDDGDDSVYGVYEFTIIDNEAIEDEDGVLLKKQ